MHAAGIEIVSDGNATGPISFECNWVVRNVAEYTCKINVRFSLQTTDAYAKHVRDKGLTSESSILVDYFPPRLELTRTLMSGERTKYNLDVSTELARELLRRAHPPFADGWSHDWVIVHIKVLAVGPDGDSAEFEQSTRLG